MSEHITDEKLAAEIGREPVFERYPALVDPDFALTVAWQKVTEWDYAADAHGWCHERPILATLTAALRESRSEVTRLQRIVDGWGKLEFSSRWAGPAGPALKKMAFQGAPLATTPAPTSSASSAGSERCLEW